MERGSIDTLLCVMRVTIAFAALLLAACGGDPDPDADPARDPAPTPRATAPAPRTPVMEVTPAPGNDASWIGPRSVPGAAAIAPYGDLLDQPVAKGTPAR